MPGQNRTWGWRCRKQFWGDRRNNPRMKQRLSRAWKPSKKRKKALWNGGDNLTWSLVTSLGRGIIALGRTARTHLRPAGPGQHCQPCKKQTQPDLQSNQNESLEQCQKTSWTAVECVHLISTKDKAETSCSVPFPNATISFKANSACTFRLAFVPDS